MRGKKARRLRQLIQFDPNLPETKELEDQSQGARLFGIIDGVNGDHRIEERHVYSKVVKSEDKMLYKQLKKVYKTKVPVDIYEQLVKDLGGQNE